MGLTPQERELFERLTATMTSEGGFSELRKHRRAAILYTLAVVSLVGAQLLFIPLGNVVVGAALYSAAVFCAARAYSAARRAGVIPFGRR